MHTLIHVYEVHVSYIYIYIYACTTIKGCKLGQLYTYEVQWQCVKINCKSISSQQAS
jgi:hypothetical protein